MKFYNRKQELLELNKLYKQAKDTARMAVITGRRRVGKTMLALEHSGKHKFVYLFLYCLNNFEIGSNSFAVKLKQ